MAVHFAIHRTCDRCGKAFDLQNRKFEEGLPHFESKPLELLYAGKRVFNFVDVCSKCDGVIHNFIERVTLVEKTDKSEKAAESAEKGKSEQPGAGDKKEDLPF